MNTLKKNLKISIYFVLFCGIFSFTTLGEDCVPVDVLYRAPNGLNIFSPSSITTECGPLDVCNVGIGGSTDICEGQKCLCIGEEQ